MDDSIMLERLLRAASEADRAGGRVILAGRCDHDNFGDSLMFAIMLRALDRLGVKADVLGASEEFMERIQSDGHAPDSVPLEEVRSSDHVALIGGGYLGQPEIGLWEWHNQFQSGYFARLAHGLPSGSTLGVIGPEVGPLWSSQSRRIASTLLNRADYITVRNLGSLRDAQRLTAQEVRVLPDLVLAGAPAYLGYLAQGTPVPARSGQIAIHGTGRFFSSNVVSRLARSALLEFITSGRPDGIVVFFDQSNYEKQLLPSVEEFLEQLPREVQASIQRYSGHLRTLTLLASAQHVVTSKLHAGISALALGTPVTCFADSPKARRFYRGHQLRGVHASLFLTSPGKKRRHLSRAASIAGDPEFRSTLERLQASASLYITPVPTDSSVSTLLD
ncbi:polysaccharide pyruvyl transferase family protein [Nitriliruptoraceae bacterium ZYF776]|nr:polysaccharide pyruvyl transferase family protein [Profundirhabdus halotolerans]